MKLKFRAFWSEINSESHYIEVNVLEWRFGEFVIQDKYEINLGWKFLCKRARHLKSLLKDELETKRPIMEKKPSIQDSKQAGSARNV